MITDDVQPSSILESMFSIFIFGICFLLVGFLFEFVAPKSDNLTTQAEGVVSRVEHKRKSYITYVQYEDHDHCVHEAKSMLNDSSKRFDVGDTVTIMYDKYNPDDRCLIEGDEDEDLLFTIVGRVILFGSGAITLVSGGILLWQRIRR